VTGNIRKRVRNADKKTEKQEYLENWEAVSSLRRVKKRENASPVPN
jgi:hypothetical protein